MSKDSVADTVSKPRDFALPIWGIVVPTVDCWVPLTAVAVSNKLTVLYASTGPLPTNPISGEPNTLFTLIKFWTSNLCLWLFCVSNSLALFNATKVVPIVSFSYPLTYALKGETPIASFVAEPPLPPVNIPLLVPDYKCSLTSKSGLVKE